MLLELARTGFSTLPVRETAIQTALTHLTRWLSDPELADWAPQIQAMIENQRWDLLFDCFYQVLPFGTGGRRGPVGVGPNRYNPWTLAASVQGHIAFLQQKYPDQKLTVVIAYDVRRYLDATGIYPKGLPNPAMGLSSRDFAEQAAGVYAANNVHVILLPPQSTDYVSTPELSFAIRHHHAHGGLNISASHNPPDDNGGKFYNDQGSQEVPPDDEVMAKLVDAVETIHRMPYLEARNQGKITDYPRSTHDAYVAMNLRTGLSPHARSAKVVFTPLHGTGDTTVAAVLSAAGFEVTLEPTQSTHDGSFPNVPFRTPNPEVRVSMERAVALAEQLGADLVMACDPDADRIGLYARDQKTGKFRFFTGNEIGALVVEYRLKYGKQTNPIVMKTEVTSGLITRIAHHYQAQSINHLMVGFKYIGEGLHHLETRGEFGGIKGNLGDFCAGLEESHGVLVTTEVRDKDAAGAALTLAEAASLLKEQGQTLTDMLEGIWNREGYLHNELVSTVMRGATGRSRIEAIQASMRQNPPTEIGGFAVTAFYDRADPQGPLGPIRSGTDAASRDVLVLELGPDRRILLRPSGTEPKNKIYVEVSGTPGADLTSEVPRVAAEARALAVAFARLMLQGVGIELPAWAVMVSDLVAIESKQHFAQVVLPGAVERLEQGVTCQAVRTWVEAEVKSYGKDPVRLVGEAVRAWVGENNRLQKELFEIFGL